MNNTILFSADWLAIHDGASASAPILGNRMCGDIIPSPIVSTGNELYLHFHSDPTRNNRGYKMVVEKGISTNSYLKSFCKDHLTICYKVYSVRDIQIIFLQLKPIPFQREQTTP